MPFKYRLICPVCAARQGRATFLRGLWKPKLNLKTTCRSCGTVLQTDWRWQTVSQLAFIIPATGAGVWVLIATQSYLLYGAAIVPFFLFNMFVYPYITRYARFFPAGLCRSCGYNLRGVPSTRCPECGAERDGQAAYSDRGSPAPRMTPP